MNKNFKEKLRRQALDKRRNFAEKKVNVVTEKVQRILSEYVHTSSFKQICLYYEIDNEVRVRDVDKRSNLGIVCGLPVVQEDKDLVFKKYDEDVLLSKNKYGVLEPSASSPDLKITNKTLIITPSILVNSKGYRIGYGGGYYDRFMEKNPQASYVGVVYSQFFGIDFIAEKHDQKLDGVVTEDGYYECS